MNGKMPTYRELCEIAPRAFREAMERRGLNRLQAFAFTYEHFGLFIDGENPWCRVLALTAVFKTAAANGVKLAADSPFTEDVISVLRSSYAREAPSELASHHETAGREGLESDMAIVTKTYLRSS